ncbi:MAG: peptidylprolyl isomerase [Ahrensia sp.]|nr:peptidylprolyl isomerase [Ahrensia sp.]
MNTKINTPRTRNFVKITALLMSFSMLTVFQTAAFAQNSEERIVGTIAGETITTRDLELTVNEMGDQLGQVPAEQKAFAALMALIDIKLLAKKAEAENIQESEEFKNRLNFLRQRALHNEFFRSKIVEAISDEDVRARYDKEVAATPAENELKASHILVGTEEEAKAIIAALDGGADFAKLAEEKSTDRGGLNGGDLGYFTKGAMVPEFEAAAFALDIGSYTKEPVKTQFGFHVIRADDLRPQQPPAFEQAAGQIRQVLLREKYFEIITALRTDAAIDIQEPNFKAAYDATIAQQNQQ